MSRPVSANVSQLRAVRGWLLAVAALIFLTLVVGGATRLTESGLSITEWKPVTGVLPPLTSEDWAAEFQKYQAIPQYRQLNYDMTLDQFQVIYWWEWTHRLLARLVGAAFLLPFLYFLARGMVPRDLQMRLWTIFAGGAVLGGVGWWMVSSGLSGSGRTSVSQYRLAFHLTLACVIYAAILWTAQNVMAKPPEEAPPRMRRTAVLIALLLLLQIYLGALVAGLDAGLSFNTWPLIDGEFIPDPERLWFETPWWRNFFENTLTVQFDHRMLAYGIWLLAVWHAIEPSRRSAELAVKTQAALLALAVTFQGVLGIATLLLQAPLFLALTHQAFAIVVLTLAVVHAARLTSHTRPAPENAVAGQSI